MALRVLYRDVGLCVVSKPAGLLSVPGIGLNKMTGNAAALLEDFLRASPVVDRSSAFCAIDEIQKAYSSAPAREEVVSGVDQRLAVQNRRRVMSEGGLPFIATSAVWAAQQRDVDSVPPERRIQPYVVHRLDEATSGLMVYGLTLPMQRALGIQWQTRAVRKVYEAVLDTRALEAMAALRATGARASSVTTAPNAHGADRGGVSSGGEWQCSAEQPLPPVWSSASALLEADEGEITTPLQPHSHLPLLSFNSDAIAAETTAAASREALASSSDPLPSHSRLLLLQGALDDTIARVMQEAAAALQGAVQASSSGQLELTQRFARFLAPLVRAEACSAAALPAFSNDARAQLPSGGALAFAATAKPSATRWRVLQRHAGMVRVELEALTGRTHQLRLHAALPPPFGLGAPILGDHFYGDPAGVHSSFLHQLLLRCIERGQAEMAADSVNEVAVGSQTDTSSSTKQQITTGALLLLSHALSSRWTDEAITASSGGSPAAGAGADRSCAPGHSNALLDKLLQSNVASVSAADGTRFTAGGPRVKFNRLLLHAREVHLVDHFNYGGAASAAAHRSASAAFAGAAPTVAARPPGHSERQHVERLRTKRGAATAPLAKAVPPADQRTDGVTTVSTRSPEWQAAMFEARQMWPVHDVSDPPQLALGGGIDSGSSTGGAAGHSGGHSGLTLHWSSSNAPQPATPPRTGDSPGSIQPAPPAVHAPRRADSSASNRRRADAARAAGPAQQAFRLRTYSAEVDDKGSGKLAPRRIVAFSASTPF
jgi:23S rRNA-/tRNA-specific pseudouridylate synthase